MLQRPTNQSHTPSTINHGHRAVFSIRLPNENREQTACRETERDRDGGVARGASQRLVIGAFGIWQAAACNPPFRKTATPPSLLGQCLRYMRGTPGLNEERSVGWADSSHWPAQSVGLMTGAFVNGNDATVGVGTP